MLLQAIIYQLVAGYLSLFRLKTATEARRSQRRDVAPLRLHFRFIDIAPSTGVPWDPFALTCCGPQRPRLRTKIFRAEDLQASVAQPLLPLTLACAGILQRLVFGSYQGPGFSRAVRASKNRALAPAENIF